MGRIFGDDHLHHACLRVDRFLLVEDEVADAVIDGFPFVLFDGLHGMGVMANQGIGTGVNQLMGLPALLGCRLQGMLCSPMQGDDDAALWV